MALGQECARSRPSGQIGRGSDNCCGELSLPIRRSVAEAECRMGLGERLREVCDTVVVLPNERLLEVEGFEIYPSTLPSASLMNY